MLAAEALEFWQTCRRFGDLLGLPGQLDLQEAAEQLCPDAAQPGGTSCTHHLCGACMLGMVQHSDPVSWSADFRHPTAAGGLACFRQAGGDSASSCRVWGSARSAHRQGGAEHLGLGQHGVTSTPARDLDLWHGGAGVGSLLAACTGLLLREAYDSAITVAAVANSDVRPRDLGAACPPVQVPGWRTQIAHQDDRVV